MLDNEEQLRYPVGRFDWDKADYSLEELLQFVIRIQSFPNELAKRMHGITEEQLNKTYRPGSWTVRQIIHHLADSHMQAWTRTKLALTEEEPVIKPYDQDAWAAGKDYGFNHEASYVLLVGLHQRWSLLLLECLKEPALLLRKWHHPGHGKTFTLAQLIAQYDWHCRQHLGHLHLALQQ